MTRLLGALTCALAAVCALSPAAGVARPRARQQRHAGGCHRGAHHARRGSRRAARCHTTHRGSARAPTGTRPAAAPAPVPGPGAGGPAGPAPAGGALPETPAPTQSPGGGGPPPPAIPRVQVTAVEYSFTLSRAAVPAGQVILQFVNRGQDEHNLNVMNGENLAGAFADTPSGGIGEQRMALRAGSYTLFCSLPEHRLKGMHATLTVE